jgi:hypothetical protein
LLEASVMWSVSSVATAPGSTKECQHPGTLAPWLRRHPGAVAAQAGGQRLQAIGATCSERHRGAGTSEGSCGHPSDAGRPGDDSDLVAQRVDIPDSDPTTSSFHRGWDLRP